MKEYFKKEIKLDNLFTPNQTIVVAVSGGVDSMVLFDILQRSSLSLKLIVCHVHHNKREEADEEYEFVKDYVINKKAQFKGLKISTDYEGNFQKYAREKRYQFFKKITKEYNASVIVTAHHQDDQVETILMRLVRGTRFANYQGMQKFSFYKGIPLIRPLLSLSKEDLYTYAKQYNIPYKEDATNKETTYTRNRYRHKIIPMLEKENPKVKNKLIQFSELIHSANKLIDKHTENFLKKSLFYNTINIDTFLREEQIVQYQILYYIINQSSSNFTEVSREQLDAIIDICKQDRPNAKITLPNDYYAIREYDYITVQKEENIQPVEITVSEVGKVKVSENLSFLFSYEKVEHINMNFTKIWYNTRVFPLTIRHRNDGDYMQLRVGRKKVKDILIDKKIPMRTRDALFVIADESKVRWIPRVKQEQIDKENNVLYIYEVTTC